MEAVSVPVRARLLLEGTFRIALTAYVIIEYISLAGAGPLFDISRSILGGIVTITAIALLPPRLRILPIGLLAAGASAALLSGASAGLLFDSLREMSNIAPMLAFVPILGVIFRRRPYGLALFGGGRTLRQSPATFQMSVSVVTHLTGAVGALSAVMIAYEVMRQAVAGYQDRLLRGGVAILRGYVTSMLWAPNATAFAIAVHYTGAPVLKAISVGLIVAVAALLLQAGFEWWEERPVAAAGASPSGDDGDDQIPDRQKLVLEFALIMAGLLGAVIVLERLLHMTLLHLVPLVSVLLVAVFSLVRGGWRQLSGSITEYFHESLPQRHRELSIMQSGGFLAGCLRHSGLGDAGVEFLVGFLPETSFALAPLLALGIIIMALIGFPPIPATLIVAASVDYSTFAVSPAYFSVSLLLGAVTGFLLAPLSIPAIVLSGMMRTGTTQIGFRANWLFGPTLFIVGQGVLWFLRAYTPLH